MVISGDSSIPFCLGFRNDFLIYQINSNTKNKLVDHVDETISVIAICTWRTVFDLEFIVHSLADRSTEQRISRHTETRSCVILYDDGDHFCVTVDDQPFAFMHKQCDEFQRASVLSVARWLNAIAFVSGIIFQCL